MTVSLREGETAILFWALAFALEDEIEEGLEGSLAVFGFLCHFQFLDDVIGMRTELATVEFPDEVSSGYQDWNKEKESPKRWHFEEFKG